MIKYSEECERTMKNFYDSLNEKNKRLYAAIESKKLGHGGIGYISKLFGCNRKRISIGIRELEDIDFLNSDKIRRFGGGRKSKLHTIKNIDNIFLKILKDYTAGDPMNKDVFWTNLTHKEIANKMKEKDVNISVTVVKQLLKKHKYVKRKMQKKTTMKECKNRNEQFENISELRNEFEKSKNPIISIDTKKKEYLGDFYRDGKIYSKKPIEVYDHDFNSFSKGILIPHGIYDIKKNKGHINIGTSHDTSEFACDSFQFWWDNYGKKTYPDATSILVLCDGGGSNSSMTYVFKREIQKVANKIGIKIRIAHYLPYCSKYNPIEHKMFCHVTRACKGVIFKSIKTVKSLIEKTSTIKGLKVTTNIIDKVYETGKKVTKEFKENTKIIFENYLPSWNYWAVPQKTNEELI